ncbi:MAG: DNA-methyltransferase, partial [Candidatus Odinarchaeota archaeon]
YITLEHEHILVFRKGEKREFKKELEKELRRESAFFWEERNQWFSDVWEIRGTSQNLFNEKTRERSAAYPFEVVYRLINMFSIKNDVVLDPFLGTGTTMIAAMCTRRNSTHFEIDPNLEETITGRLANMISWGNQIIFDRIKSHQEFVNDRLENKKSPMKHQNKNYGFPVMTGQETDLKFDLLTDLKEVNRSEFEVHYKELGTDGYKTDTGMKRDNVRKEDDNLTKWFD